MQLLSQEEGTLGLIVGFKRRNNQMPMSLNRLEKMKNSATFYLFTDKSVINKDRWIIDFECSQYISFNRKKFSSYTLVQRGEVFLENSATRNMIGEGTIQFQSHDGASLLFKAFVMFSNQGTISSLLKSYIRKGSVSVLKVIL